MGQKLRIISEQTLRSFVRACREKEFEVLAPVKENEGFVFRPIDELEEANLSYDRAFFSPLKEWLLPSRETILRFDGGAYHPVLESKKVVFLGVHPYDIAALKVLDAIYLHGKYTDPNYAERRGHMFIVGLDVKHPAENAFCPSVGSDTVSDGFDCLLTDLGNGTFLVESSDSFEYFKESREATSEEIALREKIRKDVTSRYSMKLLKAFGTIGTLLGEKLGQKFLKKAGEKCRECGNCTKVCPTCVCYTVHECPLLDGTGERVRCRSSCLFGEAARVGGDHNFRPKAEDRIANRLLDKTKFIEQEHHIFGCVGCGRCAVCPVSIAHIAQVFNSLAEEK